MPLTVTHSRIQHGVGQGSFHSATIEANDGRRSHRFDYVYDCGALRGRGPTEELKRAIQRMDIDKRQNMTGAGVIDLLVLSHYDQDHINGAKLLIHRYKVRRIVVPYLGPRELALVLASQAANISSAMVTDLHQLANGGATLLGVEVTMVRSNDREDREAVFQIDGDGGTDGEPENTDDAEQGEGEAPPRSIEPAVGSGSRPMGREMHGDDDVQLTLKTRVGSPFWKLRFWNRGADLELLDLLTTELKNCGFPIDALDTPAAARKLTQWLTDADNRKKTIQAYQKAIAKYAPTWESEAARYKIANFLSLALYSGPSYTKNGIDWKPVVDACLPAADGYPRAYPQANICIWDHRRHRLDGSINLVGWLGTGDAPLGEKKTWDDFCRHYREELQQTGTVLVPHHGAAPLRGPRFYNPNLHPRSDMLAVISVGKANTYGHPRAAVLKQIMSTGTRIELVTEDTALGLHEVFVIEA